MKKKSFSSLFKIFTSFPLCLKIFNLIKKNFIKRFQYAGATVCADAVAGEEVSGLPCCDGDLRQWREERVVVYSVGGSVHGGPLQGRKGMAQGLGGESCSPTAARRQRGRWSLRGRSWGGEADTVLNVMPRLHLSSWTLVLFHHLLRLLLTAAPENLPITSPKPIHTKSSPQQPSGAQRAKP